MLLTSSFSHWGSTISLLWTQALYFDRRSAIRNVKVIIATYNDAFLCDVQVGFVKGTVAFGYLFPPVPLLTFIRDSQWAACSVSISLCTCLASCSLCWASLSFWSCLSQLVEIWEVI